MSIATTVAAETGIDLANPKVTAEIFAPAIAKQLRAVIPSFDEALGVTQKILGAYKSLTATTTIAGAIGVAIAAVGAAKNWLDGQVDSKFAESIARRIAAKDAAVNATYKLGDWATVVRANGPPPASLNLKGSTDQYGPGIAFSGLTWAPIPA